MLKNPTPAAPARDSSEGFRRPEILAPAGNPEMMKAAVENGADAVYFGLQEFNARLRATNFEIAQLPATMAGLHERGVKGYVTLNTLIFPEELDEAVRVLRACSAAGVDAVLIQDLGLAALCQRIAPDLPIHASTQMTVTGPESVAGLIKLGLNLERVVAAREMNRLELKKLAEQCGREVEVFVHGAICVAYSGQCLTSEALGGRSANRGECAQACRLPYDLMVDGVMKDVGDVRYVLSPKDLSAYEDIPDLIESGIVSLKIEGRLKSPQYVAATVQSYRAAVDSAMEEGVARMSQATREKLEMTFSRGFTGGYLHATDHQAVVEGRFPKKRGLYLGRVLSVGGRSVTVELEAPLKPGDGLVFDAGQPDADEEGGRVYTMHIGPRDIGSFVPPGPGTFAVTLGFGDGAVNFGNVRAGQRVWKTSDPRLDAELTASFAGDQIRARRPIVAKVTAEPGKPMQLLFRDENGLEVMVYDTAPAEVATKRPMTPEVLREQLGRLGGTPFELTDLEGDLFGEPMVPLSRLNELRRRAVEALIAKRRTVGTTRRVTATTLAELRAEAGAALPASKRTGFELAVLCRTLEQVEAAVATGVATTIYTDFEDIRLHREARKLVPEGAAVFAPASLRIVKPGEATFVRKLLEAQPDAILARNLASWTILQDIAPEMEIRGDYSLNVSNDLTAALLLRAGFERLTPSYDLNIEQLLSLLRRSDAGQFEVTVHQYMPMFHMEHCVFCRFLSDGTDFTNCGRPCETHKLALRDRIGQEHLVKADAGCRNTVFNGVPQSASEYLGAMLQSGVQRFRIDFLAETAAQVKEAVATYLPALRGEASGGDLWRRLKASSKLGVTRGSMDHE